MMYDVQKLAMLENCGARYVGLGMAARKSETFMTVCTMYRTVVVWLGTGVCSKHVTCAC